MVDFSNLSSDGAKKNSNGSFQSMGLNQELLNGLNRMGYKAPTPVQRKALPIALAGLDLVCMARTGSGKTCVFLLPLIQKLKEHKSNVGIRGIVLSPTRELAVQTLKFAKDMAKFSDLRIISVIGGDPLEAQFEALASQPDVLIGTPGRLMHLLREISSLKLNQIEYLVFDEADRLFEMGFAEQLNEIVSKCPEERQTLLFSATMPKLLVQFSRAGLRDPQLIRLDTDSKMSTELRIGFFYSRSNEKISALLYLVRTIIPQDQLTIIFTATRHHSEFLHFLFNKIGISSTVVYGSMDQDARSQNLRLFRDGKVSYLIVTDLAARGLDVPLLNNVINFHFPSSPKLFVHRCGRAARQGRIGYAFSIIEPDELAYMYDVHTFLGKNMSNVYCKSEYVDHGSSGDSNSTLHGYNLATMDPSMIHSGLFPQDVLDEENDYLKTAFHEDDQLKIMWNVCENGMMQYKRTRPEATRSGIGKAKDSAKRALIKFIHPLILGSDPKRCTQDIATKADFVRTLQTFRPKETVFESGIGTGTTTETAKNIQKKKGSKNLKGIEIMKAFRKTTESSLERNKPKVTILEDSLIDKENDNANDNDNDNVVSNEIGYSGDDWDDFVRSNIENENENETNDDITDEFYDKSDKYTSIHDQTREEDPSSYGSTNDNTKRLSKAERKRMKKTNLTVEEFKMQTQSVNMCTTFSDKSSINSSDKFKDKYYMTYGTEDEVKTFIEDSMQPLSGLKSSEVQGVAKLEHALLDLMPDDAVAMNNQRRMMRWDAKKRKFVKQTLEEFSQTKGAKRVRTESGVMGKKSKLPTGEIYNKWVKKSHREVGGFEDDDSSSRPSFKYNSKVPDELRNAQQVKKLKAAKDNNKLKNMAKDKRKKIEKVNREKKNKAQFNAKKFSPTKGSSKIRCIVKV